MSEELETNMIFRSRYQTNSRRDREGCGSMTSGNEATSRLFEKGLHVIEVVRITGHKTLAMLDRYTHLDVSQLVRKPD